MGPGKSDVQRGLCGVTQAAEIQEALAEQAQHRSASIPDLIVAATAMWRGNLLGELAILKA